MAIDHLRADLIQRFQHTPQFLLSETSRKGNALQSQADHKVDEGLGNGVVLGHIQGFAIDRQSLFSLSDIEAIVVDEDLVNGFLQLSGGADDGSTSGWVELDLASGCEQCTNDSRYMDQSCGIQGYVRWAETFQLLAVVA